MRQPLANSSSVFRPVGFSALCLIALLVCGSAQAQELTLDFGDGGSIGARVIQTFLLLTFLSLVPGLAMMVTCFPFMVTVLAILRQGLGLQQSPPNMLMISLALFLTWFVMEPVFLDAWSMAVVPLTNGEIGLEAAALQGIQPFRIFMEGRVEADVLGRFLALREGADGLSEGSGVPLSVLVPSFLISEIERAFQIGFLIYLPFLMIDLVCAAVLMSMGMMMVPPVVVSLPFKLAFFVVADGWSLIAASLVSNYA